MMVINCPNVILNSIHPYKVFRFPRGEMHLILSQSLLNSSLRSFGVNVQFNFTKNEDIFELLLLCDTLKRNHIIVDQLTIPFMPFAQADRVNEDGECFSLKLFCDLINNIIQPGEVIVHDPHSDVTAALLNNCVVRHQWDILYPIIYKLILNHNSANLVCSDAGAAKKIFKLAKKLNLPVIQCEKSRDTSTGTITGTIVYCEEDLQEKDMIIVDDIVVGGKTFIEIAKILRTRNCGRIFLVTTHGVYSSGLSVFDNLIDEIWNQNGKVK